MRVCSVHLDFREERELCIVLALGKLLDLGVCSRFLLHELIAGEGQNFEALLAILLVELNHFGVVRFSESSLRGHVDDHHALFTLKEVAKADHFPINIVCLELPKTYRARLNILTSSFKETGSHSFLIFNI